MILRLPPEIAPPFETVVLAQSLADAGCVLEWDFDGLGDPWTLIVRPPPLATRFSPALRAQLPEDVWVTPPGTADYEETAWIESHALERVAAQYLDFFPPLFQEARSAAYVALWRALRADRAARFGPGTEWWEYFGSLQRPTADNITRMRRFVLLWWAGNSAEAVARDR